MNMDKFEEIEKMLLNERPTSGGPLRLETAFGSKHIAFENIIENAEKRKNFIIYVEYFPEKDRYGFAVYDKEKKK